MNKVILGGRLTRDPELKTTSSQIAVCTFTVAVDRRYKDANGQKQADFINCVAWRQTGEFVSKYFKKGSKILLTGSIQSRSWDGDDGKRHSTVEVVVDEVEFAESKQSDGSRQVAPVEQAAFSESDETALPFDI